MYELKPKNTTVCIEAVDLLDYCFSWSGKYGFFDESVLDELQEFINNGNEWSADTSSFAKLDLMKFRSEIMLQMVEKMISDEEYRNELLADLEGNMNGCFAAFRHPEGDKDMKMRFLSAAKGLKAYIPIIKEIFANPIDDAAKKKLVDTLDLIHLKHFTLVTIESITEIASE